MSKKKKKNNAICSNMDDLDIIILSKISQAKIIIWYHLYMESKKMIQAFLQNRNMLTDLENKLMVTKRDAGS